MSFGIRVYINSGRVFHSPMCKHCFGEHGSKIAIRALKGNTKIPQ